MADDTWTLETVDVVMSRRPVGIITIEGVSKVRSSVVITGNFDTAKEAARRHLANVIDKGQPGDAVRLFDHNGVERYFWDRFNDEIVRERSQQQPGTDPALPQR